MFFVRETRKKCRLCEVVLCFDVCMLLFQRSIYRDENKFTISQTKMSVSSSSSERNMGKARAAEALKETEAEHEPEAQVGHSAWHAGNTTTEKLYRSCQRYDLRSNFYQAPGQRQQSSERAEYHDHIHLCTTNCKYAKYLECISSNDPLTVMAAAAPSIRIRV
ncbi:unnamed protein product [Pleuronectes platessa]|uniref:IF140/IFT172/WDR19 TPR domain-containing protein n=1 Tax=Pleuronectes platessa TaxID=8262 RepID=A0A9N7Z3A6_PLEPL|nr:unnamed protein product [Pleuronectes platessa]